MMVLVRRGNKGILSVGMCVLLITSVFASAFLFTIVDAQEAGDEPSTAEVVENPLDYGVVMPAEDSIQGESADGTKIYEVWEQDGEVFARVSLDKANTYGSIINLSQNPGNSLRPQIAKTTDDRVILGWSDDTPGEEKQFKTRVKVLNRGADFATYEIKTLGYKVYSKDGTSKIGRFGTDWRVTDIGFPDWVKDQSVKGKPYVPLKVIVEPTAEVRKEPPAVTVDSAFICATFDKGSVLLKKSNCTSTNNVAESWFLKDSGTEVPQAFAGMKAFCDGSPVAVTVICYDNATVENTFSAKSVGTLTTVYVFTPGYLMKVNTTLSTSVTGSFMAVERLSAFDATTLKHDGKSETIAGSIPLDPHTDPLNFTGYYKNSDFIMALYLGSAGANLTSVSVEKKESIVTAEYQYGEFSGSFDLDPYICTSPSCVHVESGMVATRNDSNTCPTAQASDFVTGSPTGTTPSISYFGARIPPAGTSAKCTHGFLEWSTSPIDDVAVILGINITFTTYSASGFEPRGISGSSSPPYICKFSKMSAQPSIVDLTVQANVRSVYIDAGDDATSYADLTCSSSTTYTVPLLGAALGDAQINLGSNWFAVGLKIDTDIRNANNHRYYIDTSSPILVSIKWDFP